MKDSSVTPLCHYCQLPWHSRERASYATDKDGNAVCYQCCAWLDVIAMLNGVDPGLYLGDDNQVSNFPGTLKMHVTRKRSGRHNIAGKRTTVYFNGPHGTHWSGVEYNGVCSGNLLRQVRKLAS